MTSFGYLSRPLFLMVQRPSTSRTSNLARTLHTAPWPAHTLRRCAPFLFKEGSLKPRGQIPSEVGTMQWNVGLPLLGGPLRAQNTARRQAPALYTLRRSHVHWGIRFNHMPPAGEGCPQGGMWRRLHSTGGLLRLESRSGTVRVHRPIKWKAVAVRVTSLPFANQSLIKKSHPGLGV